MTLRALFVGLGGVGQRHLRNLKRLLGDELDPIAYRVRRENAVLSDQLTIEQDGHLERDFGLRVFHELDAALSEKPQICIIANPSSLHVPVAQRAIESGADIFVEKPLSSSLDDVARLIESTRERQRIGMVAYQLRFHPAVKKLVECVDSGMCGETYRVNAEVAEYLPGFHPYEDYRRMYASRSDQGGGVILTQIHELDLICRLFGLPQRVCCVGGKLSELQIDVEDSATSLLSYRRGDGKNWGLSLHQDYLGRPPRRTFAVFGARGQLYLDLRAGTLRFTSIDGDTRTLCDAHDHPRNQLFVDELAAFLQCVRTRQKPPVSLEEATDSLRLALAIKRSQTQGSVVELREFD